MNYLILIFLIAQAYAKIAGGELCHPPSLPFFESKLRESYQFLPAEKELKVIVKDGRNYALREEVQSLKRRLMFAKRKDIPPIVSELQVKFDQMIANVEAEEVIKDFPYTGASSVVSSSPNGSIMISVNNLKQQYLDSIPPETLKKLGKNVKIQYKYPYDSFEYFLTFDGVELPMDKALLKVGEEFEKACIVGLIENSWVKEGEQRMRPSSGGSKPQ